MQFIFYYVMGHRANANKLTDRARTEGPLRLIIIATFALHHCGIQLHATVKLYFKAFNFAWRRRQSLVNCIFFSEQLHKRMLNDFHVLENNNNSVEVNATHILL